MSKTVGNIIRNSYKKFERWRSYSNSRMQAERFRKKIVQEKGGSILNSSMRKEIKEYASDFFGDSGYRAWLELYTELRGEFKEGWIPDDYYSFEMIPALNPCDTARLSTIKSFENRIFDGFAIRPLALKISGSFYDHQQNRLSRKEFEKILAGYNDEIVIKRDSAPSGRDILFRHSSDVSVSDFDSRFNYVVQPSVKQHAALAELHSQSVNTLRVTTFLDADGSLTVKHRSMRFGVEGDRIVNRGGLFFYLDDEGHTASNALDELGLDRGEVHPDTGYPYKNLKVPCMADAIEKCKESHLKFPYVRFIAWDLYIDENGGPGMIEWNAVRPDMWVNEALIGPLWPNIHV